MNTKSLKVMEVGKPEYDKGSMYRNPADHIEVKFADGENVFVRVGDGKPFACGLCYQPGETHAEYGRLAIKAALSSLVAA